PAPADRAASGRAWRASFQPGSRFLLQQRRRLTYWRPLHPAMVRKTRPSVNRTRSSGRSGRTEAGGRHLGWMTRYPEHGTVGSVVRYGFCVEGSAMSGLLRRVRNSITGRFVANWSELRAGEGAILIAWQLLFSLFPLVVGLLAIVGFVLRDPDRQEAIVRMIVSQFPSQANDLLSFVGETRDLGGIFGLVSIVGL